MRLFTLFLGVLLLGWVLSSCGEIDFPYDCGFKEGPHLAFQNELDETISLAYQNADGVGDSVICLPGTYQELPIDAYSNMMYFQVQSSLGTDRLSLSYDIEIIEDKDKVQLLYLKNVVGTWDTTFAVHDLIIPTHQGYYDYQNIPESTDWGVNDCNYFITVQ